MEQVLVVPRKALEAQLSGELLMTQDIASVLAYIQSHHFFLSRNDAEYDTTLKQIIPYVILRQGSRYFLLRRLHQQTESRLHDKLSLGVGGHINAAEKDAPDVIQAGLLRELSEEVQVQGPYQLSCVGILNENNGGVSDFHTGIVYLMDVSGSIQVIETEKMCGSWATRQEVLTQFDALETWSQIIASHLFPPSIG